VFYAMGLCFILSSCLALVLVLRAKSAKTGECKDTLPA
jgi:hypothetical protein